MRAWTVDADDIHVAEDFDDNLLHRTPEIESFLSLDRDDKFIVIGTKGFGKTLVLKAKRILYQTQGRAACLPVNNLLDKPIGDRIFGREVEFLAKSPLPWSKLWLTAIAATVLKHLEDTDGLEVDPRLARLIADGRLRSVIDHFVRLLDFSPSELLQCATATDTFLVPRLRGVGRPVAIFIDGVDEYFNKHIENRGGGMSVTGQLAPDVWYYAQLGLVEVAYQLRRINHQLKVFAAIRKEAYARLEETTVMSQQYRGSAVDIVYSTESLREIFLNNIVREPSRTMIRPAVRDADPLEAFLGRRTVRHAPTGQSEDVFEYICRHTLLRPRDFMTIGARLAALPPEERRHEESFKAAVNGAATTIAQEYTKEIAPYVGHLDLDGLLRRLPRHILTRDEVHALFQVHNAQAPEARHVFCALHRVGLLGHVHQDTVRGRRVQPVQRFLRPGAATLDRDRVLPESTHYLLHPVMSEVIGAVNPGYLQGIDRVNIVGYDRKWRTAAPRGKRARAQLCVLVGDVAGFGSLMRANRDDRVCVALDTTVARVVGTVVAVERRAGDSVLVADRDPVALAQIASQMMDAVYGAGGLQMRIALHRGRVEMRKTNGAVVVEGGEAVLCASRVEPQVQAGQVWATEEFVRQLERKPSRWRATPVSGSPVNVKKTGSAEADLWVRLFRVER